METKALDGSRGRYRLTQPLQALLVPPTVQAILAARIDRLAAEDKRLLQTASAVGKDVPFALLQTLARALGDAHRIGRIASFMVDELLNAGDYDEAVRFGQEALSIAHTLGDRPIEVIVTANLGETHAARGELGAAATFLERNVSLEGNLRYERFGAPIIKSADSQACLADVLSQLGRFDEAIEHGEAAVRTAEGADHPFTLYWGLFHLGLVHLRRGDLPHATRLLEGGLDVCRTWQVGAGTLFVAATLGAAYALAGRADEALPLVVGAVAEFRHRQVHRQPALILQCASAACRAAGRIDEAANHAREALTLTRRLGARASEAHALCLAGDVAAAGDTADADACYHGALARAGELGMRPLVAHCHLGLGSSTAARGSARRRGSTSPPPPRRTARWACVSGSSRLNWRDAHVSVCTAGAHNSTMNPPATSLRSAAAGYRGR